MGGLPRSRRGPKPDDNNFLETIEMGRITKLAILLLIPSLMWPLAGTAGEDVAGLIHEGEAKLAAGEIDAGLALFQQAAEQDQGSAVARIRVGGALMLKQQYTDAIEAFRSAIALDGEAAPAFVGMAIAYLHIGDYSLARASLEEARRIDPSKGEKIDEILGWIEQRESGGGVH